MPDQGSSAEKTEKATPKKRRDARKKGQVLKSAEVNTAVLTLTMFLTLFLAGSWVMKQLMGFVAHCTDLMGRPQEPITDKIMTETLFDTFMNLLLMLLPFLVVNRLKGALLLVATKM